MRPPIADLPSCWKLEGRGSRRAEKTWQVMPDAKSIHLNRVIGGQ
ncbi:hypothetical protein [Fervidibacter sacchari]